MESKNLRAHTWCQSAKPKVASSTLYNFLSGASDSVSMPIMARLAEAAGVLVSEMLGEVEPRKEVAISYLVGAFGKMFETSENKVVAVPPGADAQSIDVAARVSGDSMHPLRDGWIVYLGEQQNDAAPLVGRLAAVKVRGQDAPLIREIRHGRTAGLFTLIAWNAAPIEDVEIEWARRVTAMTQPE